MFETVTTSINGLFDRLASLPFMFAADHGQMLFDYSFVPSVDLGFEDERHILFTVSRTAEGDAIVASFDDFSLVPAGLADEGDGADIVDQDAPVDPSFDLPLL